MIEYVVEVRVHKRLESKWVAYMCERHLDDVMASGYFRGCRLSRVLDHGEQTTTYVAVYTCDSERTLENYMSDAASALQADHVSEFPEGVMASRTVREVVASRANESE